MIVCHCRAVTDREIRDAIAGGARDEFDIVQACGAGGYCGGCVPAITALLSEAHCASGCPVSGALPTASGRHPGPLPEPLSEVFSLDSGNRGL